MSLSGNLEKWTNYWLGWQTRYFKLENGILSYYQNEEEVESGAKASIKIASCDIVTDLIDNTKFDVTVASGNLIKGLGGYYSLLYLYFRPEVLFAGIEHLGKANVAYCSRFGKTRNRLAGSFNKTVGR